MVTPQSEQSESNERDDEIPSLSETASQQPEQTSEDETELTEEQLDDSVEPDSQQV